MLADNLATIKRLYVNKNKFTKEQNIKYSTINYEYEHLQLENLLNL